MKFNLKQAPALVLIFCSVAFGASACAQADNPQKLDFHQVEDSVANRQKYPFLESDFIAMKDMKDTKIFVAQPADKSIKGLFFERVESPLTCGAANCDLKGFRQTPQGFAPVFKSPVGTLDTVFIRDCPDEVSLLMPGVGDPSPIGRWIYTQDKVFEFKENYDQGLKGIPPCGVKNKP